MFDKVNLSNLSAVEAERGQLTAQNKADKDFKSVFKDALEKVSQVEHAANHEQAMFIEGKTNDLHNLMLATQKATITIETAVQIQQKAIDTYNEIMRMQI